MRTWSAFCSGALALSVHMGCSSGGGEQAVTRSDSAVVAIEALGSVTLSAGIPKQITYVTALPATSVTGFEVDLLGTLGRTATTPGSAVRLAVAAAAEVDTVCASGYLFGVYEIGLDALAQRGALGHLPRDHLAGGRGLLAERRRGDGEP